MYHSNLCIDKANIDNLFPNVLSLKNVMFLGFFLETERPNWSTLHPYKVQQHKVWVHIHKRGSRKSPTVYICDRCTQVKQNRDAQNIDLNQPMICV